MSRHAAAGLRPQGGPSARVAVLDDVVEVDEVQRVVHRASRLYPSHLGAARIAGKPQASRLLQLVLAELQTCLELVRVGFLRGEQSAQVKGRAVPLRFGLAVGGRGAMPTISFVLHQTSSRWPTGIVESGKLVCGKLA